MKRCPACNHLNPMHAPRCVRVECKTFLASAPRIVVPDLGDGDMADAECPICHTALKPGNRDCAYCSVPSPSEQVAHASPKARDDQQATRLDESVVVLEWPWGRQSLDGTLIVGRAEHLPLADQLLDFDNVSNVHAEIRVQRDGVFVTDLGTLGRGSRNGTFINSRRIEAGTPCRLCDGDRLRFARDLIVTVRIRS